MQIPRALHNAGNGPSASSPWWEGGTVWLTSSRRTKDKKARMCGKQQLLQRRCEAFWVPGSQRYRTDLVAGSGGGRQTTAWHQFSQKCQSAHLSWLKSNFWGVLLEVTKHQHSHLCRYLRNKSKPWGLPCSCSEVLNWVQARPAIVEAPQLGAERSSPTLFPGAATAKAKASKATGTWEKCPWDAMRCWQFRNWQPWI